MMKNKNKNKSSAKVIDGKLIMSFPGAKTPVVWQMNLDTVKTASLEVLEKKEIFTLSLKTSEGEKEDIAKFAIRDDAVTALMSASKALETAQTKTTSNDNPPTAKPGTWKKVVGGIAALIFVFFIFGLWNANQQLQQMELAQAAGIAPTQNSAANSAGVAVSADDFLSGL